MIATLAGLLLARAEDDSDALLFEDERWSWRELLEETAVRSAALAGAAPRRPAVARRRAARQLPRVPLPGGRRRPLRRHRRRDQPDPARCRARRRHPHHRLRHDHHRAGHRPLLDGIDHGADPGAGRRRAVVRRPPRPTPGRPDRGRPGGARPGHAAAPPLHLGLDRDAQGGGVHDRPLRRALPGDPAPARGRRRRLQRDADVPRQRADGVLGAVPRPRRDLRDPTALLGVGLPRPTSSASARPTSTTSAGRCPTCSPSRSDPTRATTGCGWASAPRRPSATVAEFERRFGCPLVESYGSSEGTCFIRRVPGTPEGALGLPAERRRWTVLAPDDGALPAGALLRRRADAQPGGGDRRDRGAGAAARFEGYYNNPEADGRQDPRRRLLERRPGLPRRETGGSGSPDAPRTGSGSTRRTSRPPRSSGSWPATRTSRSRRCTRVPDPRTGDRVMATLQLSTPVSSFDPDAFAAFLAEQADLGTKWAPSFLRVTTDLPGHRDPQGRQAGAQAAAVGRAGPGLRADLGRLPPADRRAGRRAAGGVRGAPAYGPAERLTTIPAVSTWKNWSGIESARPTRVEEPADTAAIVAAVERARTEGTTVKMIGTGHSFTAISAPEHTMLRPTNLGGDRLRRPGRPDRHRARRHPAAGPQRGARAARAEPAQHGRHRRADARRRDVDRHPRHRRCGVVAVRADLRADAGHRHRRGRHRHRDREPRAARVRAPRASAPSACSPRSPSASSRSSCSRPTRRRWAGTSTSAASTSTSPSHHHVDTYWFPHTDRMLVKSNDRLDAGIDEVEPLSRWRSWWDDEFLSNSLFGALNHVTNRVPAIIPRFNQVVEPAALRAHLQRRRAQGLRLAAHRRLPRDGVRRPARGRPRPRWPRPAPRSTPPTSRSPSRSRSG